MIMVAQGLIAKVLYSDICMPTIFKDVFGSGIAWNGMEPFHSIPFHFIPSHFILAFGWSGKEGTEQHGINLKFN
jgi:hypothetical protein